MNKLEQGNNVIYGYPSPAWMADIVNLVLTYDKIYDYDGVLEPIRTQAKVLAAHFSGDSLPSEDVRGWELSAAFLMVFSIARYHALNLNIDLRKFLDRVFCDRAVHLDHAKSSRKIDCERFIKIMDAFFQMLLKNCPVVARKTINTLHELHKLFDEGIIISRENLLPKIMDERKATVDLTVQAADHDIEDETFLSLVYEGDDPWWVSFCLNGNLLASSYWGIPLHLWDIDLPLLEYKYQRGARYLPELAGKKVVQEAFSMLVPEIYILDISDLLKVRNSSEFTKFRGELDNVFTKFLKAPQDFEDANSLSEYFKRNYYTQIEQLALERCPRPGTVLLKNLVSEVHPIIGLMIGGKEVYEEYRDKYKTWRFAVSTLEIKEKVKTLLNNF